MSKDHIKERNHEVTPKKYPIRPRLIINNETKPVTKSKS